MTNAGFTRGLWHDNPAFVQLLGLCPLLAVSNSLVSGLALAAATTLVLAGSAALTSILRRWIVTTIRLPLMIMVVATLTSAVAMVMEAYFMPLYLALGLYVQIIVTNCAILAQLEACARRNALGPALTDALGRALGFAWVLVLLGAIREVLGHGQLGCGSERLFGSLGADWCVHFTSDQHGLLLMATPAGAFLTLGLLLALRNSFLAREPARPIRIMEPTER